MDERVFILSSEYALHKLGGASDSFNLFNLVNGKIFKLNKVSYTMLEAFNGKLTIDEIIENLLNRYDAEHDRIKSDFLSLVEQWVEQGILIPKGGDDSK